MPTLITREEALRRIVAEGGRPACLMCGIIERRVGPVYAIEETDTMLVMLPRYVRRWGHILVCPKPHHTAYSEVDHAVWAHANALAHKAACVLEEVRQPRRVYQASTGSAAGELTQTSMHLHIHVIPLYDADDRPADVFSWSEGVFTAEHDEWEALRGLYVTAWNRPFKAR